MLFELVTVEKVIIKIKKVNLLRHSVYCWIIFVT